MVPQISNSRIEVQTFNAPTPPIMPGTLPTPKVDIDMLLPNQTKQALPPTVQTETKIIQRAGHDKYKKEVMNDLQEEFMRVMRKKNPLYRRHYNNGVGYQVGITPPHTHTNFMLLPEERTALQILQHDKISSILEKLSSIQNDYNDYRKKLKKKMDTLGLYIDKARQLRMNYIIG